MDKSVDYYMSLPYAVELKCYGEKFGASIRELPACMATVDATDSVEKLWQLLEKNQREWIERELEMGREVPEPPSATRDPFWEDFEEGNPNYDEYEVRWMLYDYGASCFPLRVLEDLWLQELEDVRLSKVESSGAPPKAETDHYDQTTPWLRGDVRPVRLGKSLKKAWIRLEGPRTKAGYRNIEVLDKPLRTEAAIVAALTVLEATMIEDADFGRLQEALLAYVEAHVELRGESLLEVLDELPTSWFSEQKAGLDKELEHLTPEKRKNRLPPSWRQWERSHLLWKRTIRYIVALLRYRRPDFDGYTLEQQLDLVDKHRKGINELLEKHREYMRLLEYGTPKRTKRPPERVWDQVKAAVLKDVEELSLKEIANRLGVTFDEERYKVDSKIPAVTRLIEEGRRLLGKVLSSEGGWQKRAEKMKADAERYNSLSEEEKLRERTAERMGKPIDQVPFGSEFMATDFLDRRPQP
jgi:predicted RNase H-like HicB family nuclease